MQEWGKRKLAFPIRKRAMGVYYLFEYESDGDMAAKLERMFKLNQNVLRYLIAQRDPEKVITASADEKETESQKGEDEHQDNERGE